jgi:GTP pyrophosphokinase
MTGTEHEHNDDPAPRRRAPARLAAAVLLAAPVGSRSRSRPVPDAIEVIVKVHRTHHPDAEVERLIGAYRLAEASHRGQTRKSGEPFITHPLAVTMILAELGAGTTTLTAALLHDTVEDTEVTLDQVAAAFGTEVAYLVDGVTKLEKVDHGAAAEPETFRKMLVATGDDVRVMVIKLADRLHNMRTIRHMKRPSQIRIATVTRDVLIPLAERLGVQVLKAELEDIVFATLHPEAFRETRELVEARRGPAAAPAEDPLERFAAGVRRALRRARVPGRVEARARHCVSVHRLRLKRGAVDRLTPYDFGRLLVVVPEDADCYTVLGVLHAAWRPVSGEFRDFVAAPKFNLYRALHTTLAADGGVVEVLIRSRRMHRLAEAGVVTLESGGRPGPDEPRPDWLSRLLDWQREAPDADTFWHSLTAEMSGDRELRVYTTDGRTLALLPGASCVDAAYALGEETGHRCIGVLRGGRLVGLSAQLHDGDVIEVLTEPGEPTGPVPEWLACVRTPLARIAIERWLAEHPDHRADPFPGLNTAVVGRDPEPSGPPPGPPAAPPGAAAAGRPVLVGVPELPDAQPRLARCCTPVPPDALVGFAIRGGAVAVHRAGCPDGARMRSAGRPALAASWLSEEVPDGASGFRMTVHVEALNRARLLVDLTDVLGRSGVSILAIEAAPPDRLRVRHTYTVELRTPELLPELLRELRRTAGVYEVRRARSAAVADTAKRHVTRDGGHAIIGAAGPRTSG